MESRTLNWACEACSGKLHGASGDVAFTGLSTDSRSIKPGMLFVTLRGENFDAHDFLGAVATAGACAAVVERLPENLPDFPCIVVPNVRQALLQLASAYRGEYSPQVVAVAGSNGKTSTKDILAAVLGTRRRTLSSQGSFNNDVGVPLTLLALDSSHTAAVVEAGTNHPGELAPLLGCIRPQIGVITSIGREHLEHFGDLAGVAREEGALAEVLPPDGVLFIHGDGELVGSVARRARCRVVRVGTEAQCAWRLGGIRLDLEGTEFQVDAPQPAFSGTWKVALVGSHQASNALLAIAVGAGLGLSREAIQAGLLAVKAPKMRLQPVKAGPFTILVDCYNANADSTLAALDTLSALPVTGRKVAVLGDMGELGETAREAHEEVGRNAARAGIGLLVTAGKLSRVTGEAARSAGLNSVVQFDDVDGACAGVPTLLCAGDVVLVKASRSSRLERVVQSIEAAGAGRG